MQIYTITMHTWHYTFSQIYRTYDTKNELRRKRRTLGGNDVLLEVPQLNPPL